ncbi:peptidoglycan bridge formation glycyltransferase FemA/FemB family protein [Treponema pedis]|uniref:peptidoglycan bridge formation glycyltransferase FemA/FemB family protein n=1 Tax=Treponema pedis TaxID=409322 RepID=UPI0003F72E7A|nr:peptidoglycan bridge formation glycyltransferase FemA/FemB family protein [Treponema pedis]
MISVRNTDKWNQYFNLFPYNLTDIYFREEYVRLYQNKNSEAVCIIAEEEGQVILFPILRSKVNEFFDFETPYGYGGVISNTNNADWNKKAVQSIMKYCTENKYVAGFMRFHPLLHNELLCSSCVEIIFDRYTVSIDLTQAEEDIFSVQLSSKNRNMIRKAIAEGLQFCVDDDFVHLDSFINIYKNTMTRLQADNFYFFENQYYKSFVNNLKGKAFLGCVKNDKHIIAAALFMYGEIYGHYHLAGSIKNTYHGVNNLLLWGAAVEFKKRGMKEFHLGGGVNAEPENSLLKFKKAFSNNLNEFYIGKIVFDNCAYNTICRKWEITNPDKKELYGSRLLKYRY